MTALSLLNDQLNHPLFNPSCCEYNSPFLFPFFIWNFLSIIQYLFLCFYVGSMEIYSNSRYDGWEGNNNNAQENKSKGVILKHIVGTQTVISSTIKRAEVSAFPIKMLWLILQIVFCTGNVFQHESHILPPPPSDCRLEM